MAHHISSDQVLEHIQTATTASIDGVVYNTIKVDKDNLTIGTIKFPLRLFDIGGMNVETIHLLDSDNIVRTIILLGDNGQKIAHPEWKLEAYDPTKITNGKLLNK